MAKKTSQYKRYTRSKAGSVGYFSILIIAGLFMVFPMFYCIITSFKPLDELLIFPPKFYVSRPTLTNYTALPALLSNLQIPISRYIFNSVFIAGISTFLSIIAIAIFCGIIQKIKSSFIEEEIANLIKLESI